MMWPCFLPMAGGVIPATVMVACGIYLPMLYARCQILEEKVQAIQNYLRERKL